MDCCEGGRRWKRKEKKIWGPPVGVSEGELRKKILEAPQSDAGCVRVYGERRNGVGGGQRKFCGEEIEEWEGKK